MHLACKAILAAITDLDFASIDANHFEPRGDEATSFMDALDRDPIATIRSIVRQVGFQLFNSSLLFTQR